MGLVGEPRRARRAQLHRRERADVDARLPRRRAAPRCRARARRHERPRTSCRSSPRRADALSAQLGRPLTPDRRVRHERRDPDHAARGEGVTASPRSGAMTTTTRCTSRSPARPPGYYADFAPLSALAKAATKGFFHDGTWSSFRGRNHGHPIDPRVPTWRLVTFSQDHDQIGNRAAGDRLSQSARRAQPADRCRADGARARSLRCCSWARSGPRRRRGSSSPRTPSPSSGRATAEGRIEEFAKMGWDPSVVPDPQDPETFLRSKLRWDEASDGMHARVLETYRQLIALRRAEPDLNDPAFASLSADVRRRAALDPPRSRTHRHRGQPRRRGAARAGARGRGGCCGRRMPPARTSPWGRPSPSRRSRSPADRRRCCAVP